MKYKTNAVDLTDLAVGIVVLGIVVSIGATILINIRDTNTVNGTAYNLSEDAALGLAEYGNWFTIIVIVGIAAVILALIFMAFGRRGGGGGRTSPRRRRSRRQRGGGRRDMGRVAESLLSDGPSQAACLRYPLRRTRGTRPRQCGADCRCRTQAPNTPLTSKT